MAVLVDALLKKSLITYDELSDAKDKQIGAKRPIQEILLEMGFITETQLLSVSAEVFNMPIVKLELKMFS